MKIASPLASEGCTLQEDYMLKLQRAEEPLSSCQPLLPYLLMMLFIWLSFSSCCLRSRSSLSSSLALYSINNFCICCSCTKRRCSYSSKRRLDTFRRSFSLVISCSYCKEVGGRSQCIILLLTVQVGQGMHRVTHWDLLWTRIIN